jgi:L-cysteine desulfidase
MARVRLATLLVLIAVSASVMGLADDLGFSGSVGFDVTYTPVPPTSYDVGVNLALGFDISGFSFSSDTGFDLSGFQSERVSLALDLGAVEISEDLRFEPVFSRNELAIDLSIVGINFGIDWILANIGSVLLETWGNDIKIRARAMAAAGADARMSGCELPVVIVSGSGNQGITASVPVIEYAQELNSDKDTLYRALIVSNLVTIHQKTGIGRLSAYCGAVSAGVGAGAGIAWLHGGRFRQIAHTIVNGLATVSGIICDGAKPSCAAKIASAVDAGILGFYMYRKGQQFYGGDGIVTKGVENTIANVGRLGRDGMRETDREIIRIMLGE